MKNPIIKISMITLLLIITPTITNAQSPRPDENPVDIKLRIPKKISGWFGPNAQITIGDPPPPEVVYVETPRVETVHHRVYVHETSYSGDKALQREKKWLKNDIRQQERELKQQRKYANTARKNVEECNRRPSAFHREYCYRVALNHRNAQNNVIELENILRVNRIRLNELNTITGERYLPPPINIYRHENYRHNDKIAKQEIKHQRKMAKEQQKHDRKMMKEQQKHDRKMMKEHNKANKKNRRR